MKSRPYLSAALVVAALIALCPLTMDSARADTNVKAPGVRVQTRGWATRVKAPFVRVDKRGGYRTRVRAPFTRVDRVGNRVHVKAPFVNIWKNANDRD